MRVTDRQRLLFLYIRETWRRITRNAAIGRIYAMRFAGHAKSQLIVAPTDLRVVDPFVAAEMLQGRFLLAGRVLEVGRKSPFAVELPSHLFAVRLHSFGWLRHVRANKTPQACANARAIVDDWIDVHGSRINGVAWEPDVVAQRIIAWLSHSPVLLQNAENGFYRRFLKNIAFQIRYLRRIAAYSPEGTIRLRVRIALALASISTYARAATIRRAAHALDLEIDRQILPDGGHISRNPQVALELLFDLLPLRQTYINLGHDVPAKLIPAIDRMYPALRFFRHQDGDLALFNGATSTLANDLMSVLRYDESAGQPFKALPHSQYHRLAAGSSVVIIDTGHPDTVETSGTAHAGCLSFELSSGKQRFIINSGAPRFAGEKLRQMARATAAHSTVVLGERSSSRISQSRFLGPIMIGGVTTVTTTRQTGPDGSDRLIASHDGYMPIFGMMHERELRINQAGNKIAGRDRLLLPTGAPYPGAMPQPSLARFHIHPMILLEKLDDRTVRMEAPSGESWILATTTGALVIAEDVFFADVTGVCPSEQIELAFEGPEIRWFLTHHA
ncbi:MAG: heparinase II/III family protein [Allorhizobium sp.]